MFSKSSSHLKKKLKLYIFMKIFLLMLCSNIPTWEKTVYFLNSHITAIIKKLKKNKYGNIDYIQYYWSKWLAKLMIDGQGSTYRLHFIWKRNKVHYTCMLLKVHYTCMLVKYIIHVCGYGRYMLALGHEGPYNKYQNMF